MRTTRLHGLGFALLLSLSLVSSGCFGGTGDTGAGTDGGTTNTDGGTGGGTGGSTDGGTTSGACQGVICNTNQVCDPNSGNCVQCLSDSDCPTGGTCDTTTHTCSNGGGTGGGAKGPACTSAQSCGQGQVCDNGTCQPGPYGDCSKLACASGTDCLTFTTSQGTAKLCLQSCSATSDCADPTTICDTGSGDAALNHCVQNLCGPGLPSGSQGPVWAGSGTFSGPCNAAGTNDGTCWGPVDQISSFQVGLCFANGTVPAGGACDATASYGQPDKLCNGGICLPSSATSTTGTCVDFCTIADGKSCANLNGKPTACWPAPGNELAGLCVPQDASPASSGASCTAFSFQSHPSLSCVADDACLAASGGSTACTQLCNLAAQTTTCTGGTTCQKDANQDKLLGNCK